jgi:chemotaxis protein MotB
MIGVGRLLITALTVLAFYAPVAEATDFTIPVEGMDSSESVMAFSSGFLAPELPVEGTVLEDSADTQLIIGTQRTLFLRMTSFENLAPGDLFTVYRRIHQVFHPAHGQYLGWLISIRGIVQVTKIDQDLRIVTVRVVRAFDAMTPGDAVMRYSPPMAQEAPAATRTPPEKPAIVVELSMRQTLVGQRNVLYLDWGKEEGLVRGDHFDVFRPKLGRPLRWVGEIRVLSTQAHTATGLITRSPVNILKGDVLVLKENKLAVQVEEELKPLEQDVQGLEVKREGDKVTITLIDRVLFDSGQADIKPEGREVLQRVSEILRNAQDEQILVEGHTDNVRIGPTLKRVYPSNWELSRARANNVRIYLSTEGGINPDRLSSAEYADTRPVASNATEEGRQKNRRVEIILMPKEQPGGAALPTGLVR